MATRCGYEDGSRDESGSFIKRPPAPVAASSGMSSPRDRPQQPWLNEYASMRRCGEPRGCADDDYHSTATVLLRDLSPEHVYESPEMGRRAVPSSAAAAIPDYFDVEPNCCVARAAHAPCAAHTSGSGSGRQPPNVRRSQNPPLKSFSGSREDSNQPSSHVSI